MLSWVAAFAVAVTPAFSNARPSTRKVCADCVTANMARLAGEDFHGRACGTTDENAAARFIAEQLKRYRVAGGLGAGAYLQKVDFSLPVYASPPTLTVAGQDFVQGRSIVVLDPPLGTLNGPLVALATADPPEAGTGKVVLLDSFDPARAGALFAAGVLAVVVPVDDRFAKAWDQLAVRPPGPPAIVGLDPPMARPAKPLIFAKVDALSTLRGLVGQPAQFAAPRAEARMKTTYNVLGVIHGTAPDADRQAILLSAHYDHMGIINGATYHGANDDASGTAAVLEFARQLGGRKAPKRTVHFALFGCEEQGGHGAKYYLAHPPAPLGDLAANLEFEMIGVPDPAAPKTLMLTGWERSNLGPMLKAHGADIGPDKYPQENFFQRSDNYQLAKRGVVAQTISAWPVPPTYHQPTDDLAHLDLPFMVEVIGSLGGPIDWLLNSDFRPDWEPGKAP